MQSQLLNEGDLYADLGNSPYYPRTHRPAIYEFTISATMNTYVVVIGPTYAEAMQSLFTKWRPKQGERVQIAAGVAVLDA